MILFLVYTVILAQLFYWCILKPLAKHRDAEDWHKCLARED